MDDESNIQNVSINELWHKQIFMSLMKIQEYERIARDGASSIEQYIQVPREQIPNIQYQYLCQIISELDILLDNVKVKLKIEFYKKAKDEIHIIEKLIGEHPDKILIPVYDQINQRKMYNVSELFYKILHKIREIRGELVQQLTDILYGIEEHKDKKKW